MGTPDTDMRATPVSSHTASRNPGELSVSFESQPKGGRHIESQTRQTPTTLRNQNPQRFPNTYQARRRALPRGWVVAQRGTHVTDSLGKHAKGGSQPDG